jgi:hypothetical protein
MNFDLIELFELVSEGEAVGTLSDGLVVVDAQF